MIYERRTRAKQITEKQPRCWTNGRHLVRARRPPQFERLNAHDSLSEVSITITPSVHWWCPSPHPLALPEMHGPLGVYPLVVELMASGTRVPRLWSCCRPKRQLYMTPNVTDFHPVDSMKRIREGAVRTPGCCSRGPRFFTRTSRNYDSN
jgi:hypothetical protein